MNEAERDEKLSKMADIVLEVRNKNAGLEATLRTAKRDIQKLIEQNKILEQTLNAATQENQELKAIIERSSGSRT